MYQLEPQAIPSNWTWQDDLSLDDNYLILAALIARHSVSLRGHMGAVLVFPENRPIGLPQQYAATNTPCVPASSQTLTDEIHAEAALICIAAARGWNIKGSSIYVTFRPCKSCFMLMAGAGISKVVFRKNNTMRAVADAAKLWGVELIEEAYTKLAPRKTRKWLDIPSLHLTADERKAKQAERQRNTDEEDEIQDGDASRNNIVSRIWLSYTSPLEVKLNTAKFWEKWGVDVKKASERVDEDEQKAGRALSYAPSWKGWNAKQDDKHARKVKALIQKAEDQGLMGFEPILRRGGVESGVECIGGVTGREGPCEREVAQEAIEVSEVNGHVDSLSKKAKIGT